MEVYYADIRSVHILSVIASGALFVLRAAAYNLLGSGWPTLLPLRILVWTIDTTLLTAAFMLMTITRQYPLVDSWLTMKVLLLVGYVFLAWTAFRADSKQVRIACTFAAAGVFAFVYTIARAHSPLGIFA